MLTAAAIFLIAGSTSFAGGGSHTATLSGGADFVSADGIITISNSKGSKMADCVPIANGTSTCNGQGGGYKLYSYSVNLTYNDANPETCSGDNVALGTTVDCGTNGVTLVVQ
jgi:hypothetical protein